MGEEEGRSHAVAERPGFLSIEVGCIVFGTAKRYAAGRFLPQRGIGICMTQLPAIVANLIERFESPAISILHALTFVDRIVESAETLLKAPHIDRMVPELKRVHLRDRSSGGTLLSIISERRCSLRFQSCTVREVSLHSTAARIGILVAMRSLPKATVNFFTLPVALLATR